MENSHQKLLLIMHRFTLWTTALLLIRSYLYIFFLMCYVFYAAWITTHTVNINNRRFKTWYINTGACHGSMPSPLLYSLYTNNCSSLCDSGSNDTTVGGLISCDNESFHRNEAFSPFTQSVQGGNVAPLFCLALCIQGTDTEWRGGGLVVLPF